MRSSIAFIAAALLAASCVAASESQLVFLNITGMSNGTYVLTIADESITVAPVKVISPTPSPTPTPTPTPVPTPTPGLSEFAKVIKISAEKATADPNRQETAAALAAAVIELKKLVDAKTITTYQQVSQATAFLWDNTVKTAEPWKPTRTAVMDQLAKLAQEGAQAGGYAACLDDVADGLLASAPKAKAEAGGLLLKLLLAILIKTILPLIK